MTSALAKTLNGDWSLYPELKYATSLAFAGGILVDGQAAIMMNTVEPYGRDAVSEAHFERRLEGSPSSYPRKEGLYGYLGVFLLPSSESGKKQLVIGTRSCNVLVTSSMRLDISSINVGAFTRHFEPSDNTRIFLTIAGLKHAGEALVDKTLNQSQTMPALFQLKQVRSKFHRLSTYGMCRASSSFSRLLQYQPTTIWTLCEQDSNQQTDSAAKLASRVFRVIALEVIKHGPEARLVLKDVKEIVDRVQPGTRVAKTLQRIVQFEDDPVMIIGNQALNNSLTELADILATSITSSNKTKEKIMEVSAYT